MAILLRQSTASQEIPLGIFVDSVDGSTAETALSIANTDIKLWVTGATTLANKNSGGATHISGGIYYTVLDATDTATLGPMVVFVNVSGALAVRVECLVVTSAAYDVLTAATGDAYARLGAPAGASVSADVAAVKAETASIQSDTNDIQTRIPAALVSGRIDASVGAMAANVLTATAINNDAITDAKVASDVTIASVTGTVGSVTGNVGGNVTGTIGGLTAAALKDFFDTDSTTTFASAVAGSVVKEIADNAGGSSLTVADIADGVWDEALAGHAGAGSAGKALADVLVDTAEIGAAGAGLPALATQASVNIIDDFLDTEVAAILAAVDTEVAAIKAVTDAIPNAGAMTSIATAASISALNNLSAAQVNAEVVDALSTDTYAEPGAVPAATASLAAKIGWLFTLARNKITQTSTTQTIRNDADSADIATSTLSDDGTTLVRGEMT